jgi:deoxyadenosine/deoxycytidine kinase
MFTDKLKNTFIVLIGFAGTGKYTIGRELCERTGAKLIDNHLINNPIFKVVEADGITPLPPGVWDKVKTIRAIVYDAIRELSPPDLSFVFTIELIEGKPGEQKAFEDLANLAEVRNSLFVPVRLVCDVDELCRRITSPGREAMLKAISPEGARKKSSESEILKTDDPNQLTIDVTRKSPSESTDDILDEISNLLRED